jgi:hyaluronan synthase
VPAFVGVTFVMAVVKIYALATLRRQRWLTRQVAVVDGEVVRTSSDVELVGITDLTEAEGVRA